MQWVEDVTHALDNKKYTVWPQKALEHKILMQELEWDNQLMFILLPRWMISV